LESDIISFTAPYETEAINCNILQCILALAELNSRAGKLYKNEEIAMEKFMEST
jgi:hypothetical protein